MAWLSQEKLYICNYIIILSIKRKEIIMDATYIELTIRLSLALLPGWCDRHRARISCQGGGFPYPLPRGLGQCPLLCGFAVWIRIRPEGFFPCGCPGGFGHRISGRRNHHLPEERGERTDHCCWLVGDGGHRSGVRYGNVCGCSYYHGDGAAGTGSTELLDSAVGNNYHRLDLHRSIS